MKLGARVRTVDGQLGVVAASFIDRGCGCRSVIVKLDNGREWLGKQSEVTPL